VRTVSGARRLDGLSSRIVAVHEMLDSMRVPHQFGGAIALAWYRSPRATTDIDLNVTLSPQDAEPVLGALEHLGVSISTSDRALIERDGQARLDWEGSYLDLFFATLDLHLEMATGSREVAFGPALVPILSPEHLIVCKAVFDRPKDWVDIEEIVNWGTDVDAATVLRWIDALLGADSAQHERLVDLLAPKERSASPSEAP
jgi:nucleotidyltransferase AbiEii toxin of type IV toxin-antitoxin system